MPQATSTRPPRTVYITDALWDAIQRDYYGRRANGESIGKSDHLELLIKHGLQRRARPAASPPVRPRVDASPPTPPPTRRPSAPGPDRRRTIQERIAAMAAPPAQPIKLPAPPP